MNTERYKTNIYIGIAKANFSKENILIQYDA